MALKENYKDDILDTSQNVKRKYQMENNGDGTVSFTDVTEYTQQGDSFGASDMNATNGKVNALETDIDDINDNLTGKVTKFSGTDSGNTYVTVDGLAYDATNKKLGLKVNGADTVIPFSGKQPPNCVVYGQYKTSRDYTVDLTKYLVVTITNTYGGDGDYQRTDVYTIINSVITTVINGMYVSPSLSIVNGKLRVSDISEGITVAIASY